MPTSLTYTRKKPSDGDDSSVWMDCLEDNVTIDDGHDHDGSNSAFISSGSISKDTIATMSAGDWVDTSQPFTYVVPISDIPDHFKDGATSSSELCTLILMDSDNDDERVYLKYTWENTGASTVLTLYSNTAIPLKILFV